MTTYEIVSVVAAIIAFFGGALGCVVWYLLIGIIADMRALEKSLTDHKLDSVKRFATNDDIHNLTQDIKQQLQVLQSSITANNNMTAEISKNTAVLTERVEAINKKT